MIRTRLHACVDRRVAARATGVGARRAAVCFFFRPALVRSHLIWSHLSPDLVHTCLVCSLSVLLCSQGGTALMEAATSGSQEVVDLLLAAGADPMVRDKDGVSPLMSAAAQVTIASMYSSSHVLDKYTFLVLLPLFVFLSCVHSGMLLTPNVCTRIPPPSRSSSFTIHEPPDPCCCRCL